jgi:zinc D-Ala-D-Ala carboxypeptidase
MKEKISEHISYAEATLSQTAIRRGIKNEPTESHLKRMRLVAEMCFEPIRRHYGKPIRVSSFFRSPELNKAIGGSSTTSQHMQGEAIDFVCEGMADLFKWIRENVEFDQLIWEYGTDKEPAWIHISYTEQRKNRREVLQVKLVKGEMVWKRL